MTDKRIEPALSRAQWADVAKYRPDTFRAEAGPLSWFAPAEVIAVANAGLSDFDPRKITWAKVAAARFAARHAGSPHLDQLIEALESYLPPEK